MTGKKGLGLLAWIFILMLLELFFLAALLPTNVLQQAGEKEHVMTVQFLGEETANELRQKTDEIYDSSFNQTGMVKESFSLFIPTRENQAKSVGMEKMGKPWFKYVEERIIAFWTAVYLGVHRVLSLWMWLPGFIPVLFAASYDALAVRKIRQITFQSASAVVYGSSKTMFSALMFGPVVYALFPFPIQPIAAPIWCGLAVLAAYGVLVNWPRN